MILNLKRKSVESCYVHTKTQMIFKNEVTTYIHN